MGESIWSALTLSTALASALIGGVFYAFSTFVMAALARVPVPEGIRAMQTINVVVINPLFLGVFMGAALLALIVGSRAALHWSAPGSALVLAGCIAYVVGTFGVTIAANVPLNDALAAVDAESPDGAAMWARYLKEWVLWNHVRTAAAILGALLLTLGWRAAG